MEFNSTAYTESCLFLTLSFSGLIRGQARAENTEENKVMPSAFSAAPALPLSHHRKVCSLPLPGTPSPLPVLIQQARIDHLLCAECREYKMRGNEPEFPL